MRNRYIGDSLDLAKRRLLELAADLAIGTLIAPLPCQRNFQFDLYERVLDVRAPHAVHGRNVVRFSGRNRQPHLDDLDAAISTKNYQAVLFDPDSGLRQTYNNDSRYICPSEIMRLVDGRSLAWLLYHHQLTGGFRYDDVIDSLSAVGAYNFGKAAVVVGGQGKLTAKLINAIRESLNPERWIPA